MRSVDDGSVFGMRKESSAHNENLRDTPHLVRERGCVGGQPQRGQTEHGLGFALCIIPCQAAAADPARRATQP